MTVASWPGELVVAVNVLVTLHALRDLTIEEEDIAA